MNRALTSAARYGSGIVVFAWLRLASRPYRPAARGAIIVAPHPDDESLGCGGAIARFTDAGLPVDVIFVTDGAASHAGHPTLSADRVRALRRTEALAALKVLGVPPTSAHFLDLPDGTLGAISAAQQSALTGRLADFFRARPGRDTFAPWRCDGSTEHDAVHEAVRRALASAGGGTLMEYPVWAWWNPLSRLRRRLTAPGGNARLTLGALLRRKRDAIACHRTQLAPAAPWTRPVLPPAILRACTRPVELYFRSAVRAGT